MYMPEHYLHRACGDIVQELPVVRNKQYRSPICLQVIFEPLNRFNVKVVGGFVQEQHIGL